MAEIILTEAQFAAVKTLVEEARATRAYFHWLGTLARRITRDDIAQPKLSAALDRIQDFGIDLEHPRRMEEKADADVHGKGTSRSKK